MNVVFKFVYVLLCGKVGKSDRSDWFLIGRDFARRTISMKTIKKVEPCSFCFPKPPAKSKQASPNCHKLLNKLACWRRTGEYGFSSFCTDLAKLGLYYHDLRPIFPIKALPHV